MPSYTCDSVTDAFYRLTGQFSPVIRAKLAPSNPWVAGTPRATWEDGMGTILNNQLFERAVVSANGDEWADLANSDGNAVDACTTTPEIIRFGQTNRSWRMQRRNIQTDEFCVWDIRSSFQYEQIVKNVYNALQWNAKWVWGNRNQDEYIRLSDHKIVENGSFDINASATYSASTIPTSRLTNGTLELIYQYLIDNGAGEDGSIGSNDVGNQVLTLYTDANTSRDLVRQDPELLENFRYAFMGMTEKSPLIQAYGMPRAYDGYKHVINWIQPRYSVIGGVLTRIPKYLTPAAATKGYKQEVNVAYTYAQYAISIVHIPTVFTQRVPRPIGAIGAMKFDPVSYMGDFQFLNIKDKKCNPRGEKGFFDAVFASASEPGATYHGFVILHQNCPPLRNLRPSCYS
jgi:hypothetical protein